MRECTRQKPKLRQLWKPSTIDCLELFIEETGAVIKSRAGRPSLVRGAQNMCGFAAFVKNAVARIVKILSINELICFTPRRPIHPQCVREIVLPFMRPDKPPLPLGPVREPRRLSQPAPMTAPRPMKSPRPVSSPPPIRAPRPMK